MDKLIRKWPYPFKAAIAFSSDIEFMGFDVFETLMAFLNTRGQTIFGTGLGLEITSSIFHFSANPYNFSVFNGSNARAPLSAYAPRLNQYFQAGWVDTLHAFGDFDNTGGFQRAHAERCLEHLNEIDVSVSVFTNHGGIDNIQNVGSDASYHRGDHRNHFAYHSDLWADLGIRFVWTDSMVTHSAQYRSPTLRQRLDQFRHNLRMTENYPYFTNQEAGILKTVHLNDGLETIGFKRFRGTGVNAPNLSSLGHQLDQIHWQKFYNKGEGIVLYQHLGVLDRVNGRCTAVTIDAIKQRSEVYLAPFRFLAQEASEGRLWVAGCARLLSYLQMRDDIKVSYNNTGIVNLSTRSVYTRPQNDLQGLTIYIDPRNFQGLFLDGCQVSVQHNGPDQSGQYSVTVPVKELSSIWD